MGKKRLTATFVLTPVVALGAYAQKRSTAKRSDADSGKRTTTP